MSLNHLRVILKPTAPLGLYVLELVERAEDPIGERLIGERPQAFCWLEFPRIAHQCVYLSTPWEEASRRRIRASLRA